MASGWSIEDAERFIIKLVLDQYLTEEEPNNSMWGNSYVRAGPKASDILGDNFQILFDINVRFSSSAGTGTSALENLFSTTCDALHSVMKATGLSRGCPSDDLMDEPTLRFVSQMLPESREEMMSLTGISADQFVLYRAALLDVAKLAANKRTALLTDISK